MLRRAGSSEREVMALHAAFAYPTADAAAAARVTPGVMRALIQKWRIGGVGEGPAAMWEAIHTVRTVEYMYAQ